MVAGHAFTTGKIKRSSVERVLPNGFVDYTSKESCGLRLRPLHGGRAAGEDGAGRARARARDLLQHPRQGARRHLVVRARRHRQFGAAGAGGLGHQKVHAIVGGFHLGPAPADYLKQVVAEIKKLEPDVLIPMHCSGLNFTLEAQAQMPGSVISTSTGSKLTFSA